MIRYLLNSGHQGRLASGSKATDPAYFHSNARRPER